MTNPHLGVIRWSLHPIPQDFQKLLLGLFVTSGDSCSHESINYNTKALAPVFSDLFERITLEVGDDRRFRALRHSIPRLECLSRFRHR